MTAVAALWGAAAGALLPRAAYRFSAPAGQPWRDRCPGGHPVTGWLGTARCHRCTAAPGQAPPSGDPAPGTPGLAPDAGDPASGGPGRVSDAGDSASGGPGRVPDAGDSASGTPGRATAGGGFGTHAPGRVPDAGGPVAYAPGPVVPAGVTALVCGALAAATGARPELAVWLLLAPVGVLLALVDLRVARLPDP